MQMPLHVAIIMDGNGRWAQQRNLPRISGHSQGVITVEKIVKACIDLNIRILTLYVFSAENWKRPKKEVDALMNLLAEYLKQKAQFLSDKDIRINVIGYLKDLPENVKAELIHIKKKTIKNKKLFLNLAINYGSRQEIIKAVKDIILDVRKGKIKLEDVNENIFSKYLYTAELPDPDLLIRTSGEYRLSNFMLWQLSYSEIYITDKLWPDFSRQDLENALKEYNRRERKFGGLKNNVN